MRGHQFFKVAPLIVASPQYLARCGRPTQPSELVEFTPRGKFVAQVSVDSSAGAAFGMALSTNDGAIRLMARILLYLRSNR